MSHGQPYLSVAEYVYAERLQSFLLIPTYALKHVRWFNALSQMCQIATMYDMLTHSLAVLQSPMDCKNASNPPASVN